MSRLLKIDCCHECPHSQDTDACWNPATPGRTDEQGRPIGVMEIADTGAYRRGARALPVFPGCSFRAYGPVPEWCPLPEDELIPCEKLKD